MDIEICKNKEEWNEWVSLQNQAEFLQSWEWGEFKQDVGGEVLRLVVKNGGEVLAGVQGFVHGLGSGFNYLYVPRMLGEECRILESVFEFVKKQKIAFVRIEPTDPTFHIPQKVNHEVREAPLGDSTFKVSPRQPKHTLVLDITKTNEELLANMHSKTRYNIRLAERKGVIIKRDKNVDVFWDLNQETTGRDNFKSHEKNYYEKMLKMDICHQFTAYFEDKAIASNICIGFGDRFTYLHGASGNEFRNLMAPYLLQWKQIEFAKEEVNHEVREAALGQNGFESYDFWGIAPPAEGSLKTEFHNFSWRVDDKWTGITRFKVGFGGERKDYPDGVDVVLNNWKYKFYQLVKKIKR